MKNNLLILAFSLFCAINVSAQSDSPKYNKTLADSLKGDEYGMKSYVFVILKTGSSKIEDKNTIDSLFKGHMANIGRLADEGKLVVAGPFKKNDKSYRGLFILNCAMEEATAILNSDPAIKEKLLEAETYGWYGSAALPTYLHYHEMIEKASR